MLGFVFNRLDEFIFDKNSSPIGTDVATITRSWWLAVVYSGLLDGGNAGHCLRCTTLAAVSTMLDVSDLASWLADRWASRQNVLTFNMLDTIVYVTSAAIFAEFLNTSSSGRDRATTPACR